jgi:short chain dehydrogenase
MSALTNRVAFVTGRSSSIGAAIAKVFARDGANVVVHGRDIGALASVRHDIEAACDRTEFNEIEIARCFLSSAGALGGAAPEQPVRSRRHRPAIVILSGASKSKRRRKCSPRNKSAMDEVRGSCPYHSSNCSDQMRRIGETGEMCRLRCRRALIISP